MPAPEYWKIFISFIKWIIQHCSNLCLTIFLCTPLADTVPSSLSWLSSLTWFTPIYFPRLSAKIFRKSCQQLGGRKALTLCPNTLSVYSNPTWNPHSLVNSPRSCIISYFFELAIFLNFILIIDFTIELVSPDIKPRVIIPSLLSEESDLRCAKIFI